MKKISKTLRVLCLGILFLLSVASGASAEEMEAELYEKSGASGMYESLDQDTQNLLSDAGIDSAQIEGGITAERLMTAVSQMLKDKLAGPLKALAALVAIIVICKLTGCFEQSEIGETSGMVGTLACASVVVLPLMKLISTAQLVIESASVFLLASIPVYSALMVASGDVVTGGSYSILTLGTANAIPILSSAIIIPMLNIFLALAITSAFSQTKFDKLTEKLYSFTTWILLLLVTLFSGVLSIQTLLNMQADSATSKAAKLIASSAIPIVGGAFGDALAAIKSSMQVVKSGVGAFGILASLCIFLPVITETVFWVAVCGVGEIAAELFDASRIGKFMSTCTSVGKMILAVVISTAAVSVVCAAVVLFLKGSL